MNVAIAETPIPAMVYTNKVHLCPSSGVPFKGSCPVTNCPANVATVRPNSSGCAYIILDTPDLNQFNLAYLFKMPLKKVKEAIDAGKRRVYASLFVAEAFEKHVTIAPNTCCKCGVGLISSNRCLNLSKCKERILFYKHMRKRFPFMIKNLKVNRVRFYAFCAAIPQIKNAFSNIMLKTSSSFSDLIGIRPKTLNRMDRLSGPLAKRNNASPSLKEDKLKGF